MPTGHCVGVGWTPEVCTSVSPLPVIKTSSCVKNVSPVANIFTS